MRPIVGRPNFPTRALSQPIDLILKNFLIQIKENLDFLRKFSRKSNGASPLVTFDVKSLYRSIKAIRSSSSSRS